MRVAMVKKRLLSGEPCGKCAQAEELLRKRGLWERIDEVVWAIEGEPGSPGMQLGAKHGVDLAPFFVVAEAGGERVVRRVLELVRELERDAAQIATDPATADPVASVPAGSNPAGIGPIGLNPHGPAPAAAPGAASASATANPPTEGMGHSAGMQPLDLVELAQRLETCSPQEILRWGLERWGAACAIAFSGAEDVVLLDMAVGLGLPFSVFCLDTGRLHPATYRFIDEVRKHYGIEVQVYSPQAAAVEALVRRKGLFSFYEDGHAECCGVRKVEPLARALAPCSAWITGQRRDQSPSTRSSLAVLEEDAQHAGPSGRLLKLNPLAAWTSQQVWAYIREHRVPYNALHGQGYVSIGCEPCTRPTLPGEHERAGRWWWEAATQRECGLHIAHAPLPKAR